jgi:type IV pilus assembly protein PilB
MVFGLKDDQLNNKSESVFWDNDGEEEIKGLSNLYCPEEEDTIDHIKDVADILFEMGHLNCEKLAAVRQELSQRLDYDTARVIKDLQLVDEKDLALAQAQLYDFEFRTISPEQVESSSFGKLPIEYIKENRIMPVCYENDRLLLATSRPADLFIIEDAKAQVRVPVDIVVCLNENIDSVIAVMDTQQSDYSVDEIINDMTDVEVVQDVEKDFEDLEAMAGQSPVIKFVNYLISNAIHEGASDIHIEPKEKNTKIRYRIDGILFETMQSPLKMHPAIVSRIKIMSNLDISERRLPQDGKVSVIVRGRAVDLRISILPTNRGEKVVVRVLDSKSILKDLNDLGMSVGAKDLFKEQVKLPNGIMLVTGPTGSGKSTTLYTALGQMDGERLNISTVEDPVEYELAFCNQVQVNDRIGMTFAAALRSLLRQDPDIIMIGEIRDNETAKIAVQAALTGHLVLSTLHTNDAPSSITRLVNIGIDQYLIAASLNSVLAQRLVRKICSDCKEIYEVPENMRRCVERAGIRPDEFYHGVGCDKCRNTGYSGRVGIYELLIVDEVFRDMINKDASVSAMRRVFAESKQPSLFTDGVLKVKQGLTTLEEVLRVTEMYGQGDKEESVDDIVEAE